jgi:hypothetical protein
MMAKLLATFGVTTITESHDDLLPEIKAAQETDFLGTEIRPTLVDGSTGDESECRSIDGALTNEWRLYVPAALRSRELSLFHHNSDSGHFGALQTAQLVPRDFKWPAMESEIQKYAVGCELCHRIKDQVDAPCVFNMPM